MNAFTLWHAILFLTLILSISIVVQAIRRFRKRQSFNLLGKVSVGTACVLLSFLCYLSCYFYLRWTNRLVVRDFADNAHLCRSAVQNPNVITERPLLRGRGSFFRLAFVVERNLLFRGYPLWHTSFELVPPSYGSAFVWLRSEPNHTSKIKERLPFLEPLQFNYAISKWQRQRETIHFSCDRIRELYAKLLQDNEFTRGDVILNGVTFDRRTVDSTKEVLTAQFTLRDSSLIGFPWKRAKLLLMIDQNEVRLMVENGYW